MSSSSATQNIFSNSASQNTFPAQAPQNAFAAPAAQNPTFTSPHPREDAWDETNLPDELFQLEPFKDWGAGELPSFTAPRLDDDGRRMTDGSTRAYRVFDVPSQISINSDVWRLEYWTDRMHPKFGVRDLYIRMQPGPGDKILTTNAINMKKSRLRNALNIPNWSRLQEVATCVECLIAEQISDSSVRHNTTLTVRPEGLERVTLVDGKSTAPTAPPTFLPLNRFLRNNVPHQPSRKYQAKQRLIAELRRMAFREGYPHWIFLPNKFKPKEWQDKATGQKCSRAEDDDIKIPEQNAIPQKALKHIKRCVRDWAAARKPIPMVDKLPSHARWVQSCVDEGVARRKEPGYSQSRDDREREADLSGDPSYGGAAHSANPFYVPPGSGKRRRQDEGSEENGEEDRPNNAPRKRQRVAQAIQDETIGSDIRILGPSPAVRRYWSGRIQIGQVHPRERSFTDLPSDSSHPLDDTPRRHTSATARQESAMKTGSMKRAARVKLVGGPYEYHIEAQDGGIIDDAMTVGEAVSRMDPLDKMMVRFMGENQRLADRRIAEESSAYNAIDEELIEELIRESHRASNPRGQYPGLLSRDAQPPIATSNQDGGYNGLGGRSQEAGASVYRAGSTKRSRQAFEVEDNEDGEINQKRRRIAEPRRTRVEISPYQPMFERPTQSYGSGLFPVVSPAFNLDAATMIRNHEAWNGPDNDDWLTIPIDGQGNGDPLFDANVESLFSAPTRASEDGDPLPPSSNNVGEAAAALDGRSAQNHDRFSSNASEPAEGDRDGNVLPVMAATIGEPAVILEADTQIPAELTSNATEPTRPTGDSFSAAATNVNEASPIIHSTAEWKQGMQALEDWDWDELVDLDGSAG